MYICGLGLYEVFVDNAPVSDSLLEPAYTKYDAFALYRVYDITSFLTQKDYAAVGVVLGNGWYNCFTKDEWNTPQASWRAAPKLLCEIHIEYLDGSTECIGSDEAWSVSRDGPIVFNAIRSGEWYDARKEDPKWVSGKQIIGRGRLQSVSAALAERFARRRMTRSVSRRRSHLFRQESRQRAV